RTRTRGGLFVTTLGRSLLVLCSASRRHRRGLTALGVMPAGLCDSSDGSRCRPYSGRGVRTTGSTGGGSTEDTCRAADIRDAGRRCRTGRLNGDGRCVSCAREVLLPRGNECGFCCRTDGATGRSTHGRGRRIF